MRLVCAANRARGPAWRIIIACDAPAACKEVDALRKHTDVNGGDVCISLLGGFRVAIGARQIEESAWRLRRARSLVKVLALAPRRRMHREQIVELLWPDAEAEAAANGLHQVLYVARRAFSPAEEHGSSATSPAGVASRRGQEPAPATPHPRNSEPLSGAIRRRSREPAPAAPGNSGLLEFQDDLLQLCPSRSVWIDVEAFEAAAVEARHARSAAAFQAAVDLYGGELLPEDPYEEWAAARRAALRQTYLELLREQAGLFEADRDYSAAIGALRALLAADEADEEAHCRLMRLYAVTGQRGQALRQYGLLRDVLREELDAAPQEASRLLYEEILAGRSGHGDSPEAIPAGRSGHGDRSEQQPLPSATASEERAGTHGALSPPSTIDLPSRGREARLPLVRRDNLPVQISSFVGRARDLAEVKGLLARTRLLTLTGAGGCGKTRLALQVAAGLRGQYADGVWLVDLAGTSQPSLAPQAVAAALGVPEQQRRPVLETLLGHLQDRDLLLVLDNCEHLVATCAELAERLARACPRLRILATSREPLRVAGEVVWRVSSLGVPDPRQLPALDLLRGFEAVQLLIERGQAIEPSFTVSEQTAPAVAWICYRLDGLPLAIEMAAARLSTLSVEQIAARLDDCFRLLTGGSRTALSRQQTLRSTLDWSYDLLSRQQRLLFQRLAVFAGGFNLEAVEAAGSGAGIGEADVLDLVHALADCSLIAVETYGGEPRYRLLEPIRQYARQRLDASGEAAAVRDRHGAWYLALAEQARDDLWTPRHGAALARLEREHDNLRAALDWSVDGAESAASGLRLVSALSQFWLLRGYLAEGHRRLDMILERVPERSGPRASALLHVYALASRVGETAAASEAAAQSLAIYRELHDTEGALHAAHCLGIRAWISGRQTWAEALFEENLALSLAAGFAVGAALATHALGVLAWWRGDHDRAGMLLRESVARLGVAPDRRGIALAFLNIGVFETAIRGGPPSLLIEEPLALMREVSTGMALGYALANLGNLARVQGNYGDARRYLDESVAQFQRIGNQSGQAQALGQLGNLARVEGSYARAAALLDECLALRRDMGEQLGFGRTLGSLGSLALARGNTVEARALCEESLTLFRALGDGPGTASALERLAFLARSTGDYDRARALYTEARAVYEQMGGSAPFIGFTLLNQGDTAYAQGDYAAARSYREDSLAMFAELDGRRSAVLHRLAGDGWQG